MQTSLLLFGTLTLVIPSSSFVTQFSSLRPSHALKYQEITGHVKRAPGSFASQTRNKFSVNCLNMLMADAAVQNTVSNAQAAASVPQVAASSSQAIVSGSAGAAASSAVSLPAAPPADAAAGAASDALPAVGNIISQVKDFFRPVVKSIFSVFASGIIACFHPCRSLATIPQCLLSLLVLPLCSVL